MLGINSSALIDCIEAIKLNQQWIKESETHLFSRNIALIKKSVSNRIINEVAGINRVVYDITSKPPCKLEWE